MTVFARICYGDVAYFTAPTRHEQFRFGFFERSGGVSQDSFSSLNLSDRCGDDIQAVHENRLRALEALGAQTFASQLIVPHQVHGTDVVVLSEDTLAACASAQLQAAQGADAVVCSVPSVPVLLNFADCVPLVLSAPGAFAVAHSGWRGTISRIGALTLAKLCEVAHCDPTAVDIMIGPHIQAADYEVSEELLQEFVQKFDASVVVGERNLSLLRALYLTFEDAGCTSDQVSYVDISTADPESNFFSYRASRGHCGRHGALAYMVPHAGKEALYDR